MRMLQKVFIVCLLMACTSGIFTPALAVNYEEFVNGYNSAGAAAKDKSPTGTWSKARSYANGSAQSYEIKLSSVYVSAVANVEDGTVRGVDVGGKTKNHAAFVRTFDHALAALMPSFSAADRATVIKRARLNDKAFIKEAQKGMNGFFHTAEYKGIEIMTAAGADKGTLGSSFWLK